MIEYRIQGKYAKDDDWKFITDPHGKYYSYTSLANAKRYGSIHAYQIYDEETQRWYPSPEQFRIVWADIDWKTVDLDEV